VSALRLVTRGSALALTQSRGVVARLEALSPGLKVELSILKSEGDQRTDVALSAVGGQGLFTKALEECLQRGEADLAVHSLKDLPTQLAAGLTLAAVSEREDWRDAWISPKAATPWELAQGALLGTGSLRRRAQLLQRRSDLRFAELRGNVDTRLRKIANGEVDGAVLAMAGLKRLGLQAQVRYIFSEDEMLPAPSQGFLGIETREWGEALELCRALNSPQAFAEAACERALLARLEAGCHAPVAGLARMSGNEMHLKAFVALGPGAPIKAEKRGAASDPVALAWALADEILAGR